MQTADIIKDFAEWGVFDGQIEHRNYGLLTGNDNAAELIAEAAAVRWLQRSGRYVELCTIGNTDSPNAEYCVRVYYDTGTMSGPSFDKQWTGKSRLEALHAAVKAVRGE